MTGLEPVLSQISEAGYEKLKLVVETSRWPDGSRLSELQKEQALQLLMAYQARYLEQDQHLTIGADGQMIHKTKEELKRQFSDEAPD